MSLKNRKKKIEVLVGADHGGVALKDELLSLLTNLGVTWKDVGTFGTAAVDYPDIAFQVARAAVCNDLYSVRMARAHNDANVLALGGRMIGSGLAREIVTAFLTTPFEKGRHLRRIKKMEGGCS
jgi:ribose 5-phosphate isomerase B